MEIEDVGTVAMPNPCELRGLLCLVASDPDRVDNHPQGSTRGRLSTVAPKPRK
jgi:hypothetical protein